MVSSQVVWRGVGSSGESDSSGSLFSTSYTIENLQPVSIYNVTVTVFTATSGIFRDSGVTFTGKKNRSLSLICVVNSSTQD